MNDKQLIELAAKAAGIRHDGVGYLSDTGCPMNWNPLTDDGDALRLAVRLQMQVSVEDVRSGVVTAAFGDDFDRYVEVRTDPNRTADAGKLSPHAFSAARRAIVSAAAIIGDGMQ